MKFNYWLGRKRSRPYPIKYDKNGLSLRARCFNLFELGKRPAEVAVELKAKETTVLRYFRDWKRRGPNFDIRYAYVKSLFSKTSPERDKNLEQFSRTCGISKKDFEVILSQPYGLRRVLTGKYYFPVQADADHKRSVALRLALLFSEYLLKYHANIEDIYFALGRFIKSNMEMREVEDAEIEESNHLMKIMHAVLAVDLENERKGRVKPDELSPEEREALIKYGIESEKKKAEITYWFQVGCLMAAGLTREQASESIYQIVIEKGTPEVAKAFRQYLDRVDPPKNHGI